MQTYYRVIDTGDYEGCATGLYCDPDLLAAAQAAAGAPVAADALQAGGAIKNPMITNAPPTNLYIPAWTADPPDPAYQVDPTTYYRDGDGMEGQLTAADRAHQAQVSFEPPDTPVNVNVSYANVGGIPTLIVDPR